MSSLAKIKKRYVIIVVMKNVPVSDEVYQKLTELSVKHGLPIQKLMETLVGTDDIKVVAEKKEKNRKELDRLRQMKVDLKESYHQRLELCKDEKEKTLITNEYRAKIAYLERKLRKEESDD